MKRYLFSLHSGEDTLSCFWQRERSLHLTGQLLPTSSWAALANKLLPQSACSTGCIGLRDTSILNHNQSVNTAPSKTTKNQRKKTVFRIGCWNVWTMITGLSDDLCEIYCKTAVINNELLQVDIASLQETWLPKSVTLHEREYTFFWQEKGKGEIREHGVGFTVKNLLLKIMESSYFNCIPLMELST